MRFYCPAFSSVLAQVIIFQMIFSRKYEPYGRSCASMHTDDEKEFIALRLSRALLSFHKSRIKATEENENVNSEDFSLAGTVEVLEKEEKILRSELLRNFKVELSFWKALS